MVMYFPGNPVLPNSAEESWYCSRILIFVGVKYNPRGCATLM